LDPPAWSSEENAWRTNKINVQTITVPSNDETAEGSTTYPPEIGPRDFNGELFVTSNDDGMAVWTMGSGHKEKNPKEKDDALSVVSSISDGEKDIESAPSRNKRIASSSIVEASDDLDIQRGAAIVINKLREKTRSLRDSAKSYRLPSLAISTSCATPSKHKEEQTTDTKEMTDEFKERMRVAALMDSSNSEFTEDQPGIKVTIICPDGSKEEAKFSTMNSCFIDDGQLLQEADLASTHLVKQAKHASTPAKQEDPKPIIRSRTPKAKLGPEVTKRVSSVRSRESVPKAKAVPEVPIRVSSNLPRVPLSKVAVQAPTGTTEYSEDGVSEMTNGFSETTPGDGDIRRDTISILEDLARSY
jgi:hypothetical protein